MDRSSALTPLRAAVTAFARRYPADRWCIGLSGGADSLALTAVAAALKPTTALIVDHGLQTGSAEVALVSTRSFALERTDISLNALRQAAPPTVASTL